MVDYNNKAQVIEEYELGENLKYSISVTFDETKVFFDVDYMDGKFTLQRSFTNNYIGLEQLEEIKKSFGSEESVKNYFGL